MGWEGTDPADWAERQHRNLRDILRFSSQGLLNEMGRGRGAGGLIPVDTGNLARSPVADVTPVKTKDGPFSGPDAAALVSLDLGDHAYLGWQARYAARLNYGFSGADSLGRQYAQGGLGFAETLAAGWQGHVDEAVKKVEG